MIIQKNESKDCLQLAKANLISELVLDLKKLITLVIPFLTRLS